MSIFRMIWVVVLIILNGFFVAAEFALVKVRASQLEIKLQSGHPLGKLAKHVHAKMDAYLSATQLGITITSLGVGWVGEEAFAHTLLNVMTRFNLDAGQLPVHQLSFVLAFVLISLFHIVIGELVPKSMAIQHPLGVMFAVVAPLRGFYVVFSPAIWFLNHLAFVVLRLFGLKPVDHVESHSAEELRLLLEQGKNQGLIRSVEHDIIKNVFYSSEKTVQHIMIPRSQIESVSVSATDEEMIERFLIEGYSRLPVYQDDLDNIVGVLYAKEVLKAIQYHKVHPEEPFNWKDKMSKPHFVPESKKVITLLREFQSKRFHMALVVDEFGSVSGLVTIEDVIEELVGEIQDEYDTEAPMVEQTGKKEWRINGLAPLSTVNQYLDPPLPESNEYDTVSGLMNWSCGRIPRVQDKIKSFGYEITVLKASKRRIETVKFRLL
jgi:CBS domain containing-hemolysin-like protein